MGIFEREREIRKGRLKGKLKGTSPPGEKGGPISNSSRKNTLVSGKRECLEGERKETTPPIPTSVLHPGNTKRRVVFSVREKKASPSSLF